MPEVATAALADEFYREFKLAVKEAARRPESFRIRARDIRGANLSRFPFHFLFRIVPFAFWSFATTRDILPSEFGAAETRWDRGSGSLGTHRGRRSKEGGQRYWVHVAN